MSTSKEHGGWQDEHPQSNGQARSKKTFVLCFDGTGNKFTGDETDSNILKIYRMLDRADGMTFTFYQPGIGTYVSGTLQTTGAVARFKSWYHKSKDAAVGSSFAEHVMGGYRFLMRYYSTDDDLYFFGFSRGAYTARFLAEMLDHVGLLSAGNEELARFAWKTYAKWASREIGHSKEEKARERDLYAFMRGFRETFSRRVRRIRFLGLFDTVNSVPAFESAWMQRSKFPYTARSSAKVIRHAVSIDERRAKFRQDLVSGSRKENSDIHRYQSDLTSKARADTQHNDAGAALGAAAVSREHLTQTQVSTVPSINIQDASPDLEKDFVLAKPSVEDFADAWEKQPEHSQAATAQPKYRKGSFAGDYVTRSVEELNQHYQNAQARLGRKHRHRRWSDSTKQQDIQEVWFPGCHGDIGGGWKRGDNEHRMLSFVPLVWMVTEAEKAGLRFDPQKMHDLHCCRDKLDEYGERQYCPDTEKQFFLNLESSLSKGIIHDSLDFKGGLGFSGTLAWRLMEYLPFRRMDLQVDGSWKPIRWPLPCGETRDIPQEAHIHSSAIRRMQHDPKYRPGNLIIGGGGRGVKIASERYGIGEWEPASSQPDDPVTQTFFRKRNVEDAGKQNS